MDREITKELQQILASEPFRSAKRSRDFLTHIVKIACAGNVDQLKERTLGMEFFGRAASYDTGEDAIVRVKASEVRRRLSQYEVSADPQRLIKIVLPPGSYVPQFLRATPKPTPIEPTSLEPLPVAPLSIDSVQPIALEADYRTRYTPKMLILTSAFALLLALISYGVHVFTPQPDSLKMFWNPLIKGRAPLLICIGYPTVYLPVKGEQQDSRRATAAINLPSSASSLSQPLDTLNVVGVPHAFVAIGDSDAGFLIGRTLQSFGKPSQIRIGSDTSFSELKSSQVVLIGAYSNKWTMLMTEGLRFSFVERDHRRMIVDRDEPDRFWDDPALSATGKTSADYALVSRIYNPDTAQTIIAVAGISRYGSQAAAEFFTDPASVATILHLAPKDWKGKNLQVVLKTKVV
ncbi:MAG: hypothetical protein WA602_07375, partial [Silvibacterium sp.]